MIGLFGGTCNNMYVFAKVLAGNGYSIKFIEDRGDNFPHGQPVWDDVDACFESGFDYSGIDWLEFEAKYNWKPPIWYIRPDSIRGGEKGVLEKSSVALIVKYLACRYLRTNTYTLSVFEHMSTCDFLIVCGIKASIIAMLSGKPYMIFPHGSDMRVAIGAEKKGSGLKGLLVDWLVTKSFRRASFIGSSLPDASAEVSKEDYRRLKKMVVERLPLPYVSELRLSTQQRNDGLKQLLADLGLGFPEAKYYCFTPSRINFCWKGHDRLLSAIKNGGVALDIHFIFLGWGDDYLEAQNFIEKNKLHQQVTVLPVFLSKKYLFRFFKVVDFIIDELNGSGSYGTSLSEAMSMGCPVVTWISDMFDRPGWEAPPVIYAQTEVELGQALMAISKGDINLDQQSEKVVHWFDQVHDSFAVLSCLDRKLTRIVSNNDEG